ncbi:NINE protein [Helicobacter cappadocius]|uniref:NINE protein n=1 Tax=Helicobacter cappadocius TaxID=3063998 RepID=A0AA90PRN2_9HELI|nr:MULTISPECIES: NINE protein [unclassified Helicobacter]MDO7252347.1 NINE protein [Helicobacter sp. faydin-H75]MDP2538214.1 NINE protein [Helicobacter sp. faydin-H76]
MTITELIKEVLQMSDYPLTAAEIWDVACQKGLDKKLSQISPDPVAEISIYTTKNTNDFIQYKFKPSKFWLVSKGDCSVSLPFLLLEVIENKKSDFPTKALKNAADFFQELFDLREGALSLKIKPIEKKPFEVPKKSLVTGRLLAIFFGYLGLGSFYAERYVEGFVQLFLFISFPVLWIFVSFFGFNLGDLWIQDICWIWIFSVPIWWIYSIFLISRYVQNYNLIWESKWKDYEDTLIKDWNVKREEMNFLGLKHLEKMHILFSKVIPIVKTIDELPVKMEVLAGICQGLIDIVAEEQARMLDEIEAENERLQAQREAEEEAQRIEEEREDIANRAAEKIAPQMQYMFEKQQMESNKKIEELKREVKSAKRHTDVGIGVGVANLLKQINKK